MKQAKKITHHVKRPVFNEEERKQNYRHSSQKYYHKMRERGYRSYQVFLPNEIRAGIVSYVRGEINAYQEGRGEV